MVYIMSVYVDYPAHACAIVCLCGFLHSSSASSVTNGLSAVTCHIFYSGVQSGADSPVRRFIIPSGEAARVGLPRDRVLKKGRRRGTGKREEISEESLLTFPQMF